MSLIICGIDPGGTSGVAMIEWDGSPLPDPDWLIFHDHFSYETMPQFVEDLTAGGRGYPAPDIIAIERFHISTRTIKASSQPEALYVIGGVLFYAANAGIHTRIQNASDAKNGVKDDIIDVWDVKNRHEKDALRHVLLACRSRGLYSSVSRTILTHEGDEP